MIRPYAAVAGFCTSLKIVRMPSMADDHFWAPSQGNVEETRTAPRGSRSSRAIGGKDSIGALGKGL